MGAKTVAINSGTQSPKAHNYNHAQEQDEYRAAKAKYELEQRRKVRASQSEVILQNLATNHTEPFGCLLYSLLSEIWMYILHYI